jgi:hypothetical protein
MIEADTSRERLELAVSDAKPSGLTWVHVDDLRALLARAEKAEAERDTAWNDAIEAAAECVGHITQSEDRDAIMALLDADMTAPKPDAVWEGFIALARNALKGDDQ